MIIDFLDRRRAERFAELLDETPGSPPRRHTRGQADEQLAELVAIGQSLTTARTGPRVDPEFRVGLRAMLVATAERDGIGSTAVADPEPEPARTRVFGIGGRRIRTRGAIIAGVAAGAMAVSGISAASENASPGDALYGVKRSTERAQLAMAGSDVSRGQLSLDFAEKRLGEAAALSPGDTSFAGVLNDMDSDTRKGVKLLTTSAVSRTDSKPLSSIDTFVSVQRKVLIPALDRLTTSNRQRAMTSLNLLDQVQERSADIRSGLACKPISTAGPVDALGPQLAPCRHDDGQGSAHGSGNGVPGSGRPTAHAVKPTAKPGRTSQVAPRPDSSASPESSGDVNLPRGTNGSDLTPLGGDNDNDSDNDGTTPAPSTSASSGVLSGLLGGLLGGS